MAKRPGLSEVMKRGTAGAPERPQIAPERPRGRRSDPNYSQLAVWVSTANHDALRREAFESRRDMSEIVDEMLGERYAKG